jgi:hypothetical protein
MKSRWNIRSSSLALLLALALTLPAHAGVICAGSDDYLDTGQVGSVFFSATAATMMMWVRPTGAATADGISVYQGQAIMGDADGWMGLYRTTIGGVDKLNAYNNDDNPADDTQVGAAFTNNAWTHLAFVQSASALTLYKDGVSVGTEPLSTGMAHLADSVVYGCAGYGFGSLFFQGQVTDIRLFNTVLTASQIEVIAANRLVYGGTFNGTAYWTLDQCADGASGDGVGFADRTGNGRILTGANGAVDTGPTCTGSSLLAWPVGAN